MKCTNIPGKDLGLCVACWLVVMGQRKIMKISHAVVDMDQFRHQ